MGFLRFPRPRPSLLGSALLRLPLLGLALPGLALLLVGCTPPRQGGDSGSGGGKLEVVTTFLPMTLFTRAVAGDCAEVKALIPPGTGPHDFQASPGDLVALRRARVLVKNGLEMEGFLGKVVAAAGNPELTVIDSSRGVATIDSPGRDAHGHGHDHGHAHGHGHGHGAVNPHIWLDPLRAAKQVETIRDGLIKADPGCAEGYRRNAEAFTARLRALHGEIAGQLGPYRGKSFVAFHDVAPYFAARYGLAAHFLVDVPEENPSPADLQRVADEVKRTGLRALLSEPQQGSRSFNALARDLGVRIGEFDPLETASEEASRDPDTYFRVMRSNVARLREAFGG